MDTHRHAVLGGRDRAVVILSEGIIATLGIIGDGHDVSQKGEQTWRDIRCTHKEDLQTNEQRTNATIKYNRIRSSR